MTAFLSCSASQREANLYGDWRGEHGGQQVTVSFDAGRSCRFVLTRSGTNERTEISGHFETDFRRRPVPLTIRDIPQLDHPLHTVLRLEGDTLTVAPFAPRWRLRPVSFPSDSLVLRRER